MSKSQYIPFRAPPAIVELVENAIAKTKLSKNEVMRQGLELGIPRLVARRQRPRRSLVVYLDKFSRLNLRPNDRPAAKSRFA